MERRILAYNNLAYHLLLLGESGREEYGPAIAYARKGLALAQQKGMIGLLPYLLSTLGEITLAGVNAHLVGVQTAIEKVEPVMQATAPLLDTAEQYFNEGLEVARRLAIPERVAGLTANLGLVARQRGQEALAIHRLSAALSQADALGVKHLAAQVRIWLAPLLPIAERQALLREARAFAESSQRRRLLEQIEQLEMHRANLVDKGDLPRK